MYTWRSVFSSVEVDSVDEFYIINADTRSDGAIKENQGEAS